MQSHNSVEGNLWFRLPVEPQYVKLTAYPCLPRFTLFAKDLDAASKKTYCDDLLRKSRIIDRFHSTIAPVTPGGSSDSNAQLLVVHTYIRVATIRLGIFDSWKAKRLEAATAVANMLGVVDVSSTGYMPPVMGVSHHASSKNTPQC